MGEVGEQWEVRVERDIREWTEFGGWLDVGKDIGNPDT